MLRPKYARLTGLLLAAIAAGASADTTILSENFDNLTQTQFESEWTVGVSPSTNPPLQVSYIESPDDEFSQIDWPGLTEIAASHFGRAGDPVVTWNGLSAANALTPTESQSIHLSVDIFDNATGNKRISLGLRDGAGSDIIELGFWNAEPANGYAHRAIVFPSTPENPNPNWAGFELDTSLDRPDDADEITTISDIGSGWHTWSVMITPSEMTFELDLFRDGQINSKDSEGEIIGIGAGVDSSVTYQIDASASTFSSLRFGGPSGVSSPAGGVLFDNILLELVDTVVATDLAGDYNDSGSVEQGDLDLVLNNWGQARPFDPNTDPFATSGVDQEELDRVLNNWGNSSAPAFNGVAVPEPATLSLLAGLALAGRRRSAR